MALGLCTQSTNKYIFKSEFMTISVKKTYRPKRERFQAGTVLFLPDSANHKRASTHGGELHAHEGERCNY